MQRNDFLEFRLMGGVGNQLFIASFAALWLEEHNKQKRVVLNSTELSAQSHGSGLLNLDLECFLGSIVKNLEFTNPPLVLSRVIDRFRPSKFWTPTEVGFLGSARTAVPEGTRIARAYFQSSQYVERLRELGAPLEITPKDPSREYSRAKFEMDWGGVAVIHMRRGDYRLLADSFGVLAISYFTAGIKVLQREGFETFVVMSDDPGAHAALASVSSNLKLISMASLNLASAEEELSLASSAGGIIMSNSSFSFWAAYGGGPKRILAPNPWFKNTCPPADLVHDFLGFDASLLPSTWEDSI